MKTKQRQQTDGEALVQCSLDGFRVLSLNFGGDRSPRSPTFRMYAPHTVQNQNCEINWSIKTIVGEYNENLTFNHFRHTRTYLLTFVFSFLYLTFP